MAIETVLMDIEIRRVTMTPASLQRVVKRALNGNGRADTYPVASAFEAKMKLLRTESTRAFYKRCLDAIKEYTDLDSLMMRDVDYGWLCDFEAHLRRHNCTNTVSILLRSLRAVFNHAIKTGDIERDCYPFLSYTIRQEETRKRALTLEQLRVIRDHGGKYGDIFMLSFYLLGINIGDLCHLKEISPDGRIDYRRRKTGKLYSIKVEPEAMEIINRYRGDKWLIGIMDGRAIPLEGHRTFMYNLNRRLKSIVPGVSTYWARHTWATIAAELDVPNEVIAQGLGHSFGNSTTAIYIKPNAKKVDDANRRVIDYVNGYSRQ